MAKPPDYGALTREALQDAPAWVEKLLRPLNTLGQGTRDAMRGGLTIADNLAAEVREVTLAAPEDWTALSLTGGWTRHPDTAFVSPGWRKAEDGRVYLRGLLTRAAGVPAAGSALATGLPAPVGHSRHAAEQDAAHAALDVQAGGTLAWVSGPGTAGTLSLADVQYDAADRAPAAWASPLTLVLGPRFSAPPALLWVARCVDAATKAPLSCGVPTWAPTTVDGRPAVRLSRVPGLTPGVRVTLTLVIAAG